MGITSANNLFLNYSRIRDIIGHNLFLRKNIKFVFFEQKKSGLGTQNLRRGIKNENTLNCVYYPITHFCDFMCTKAKRN